jgi:hypothetical protein
MPMTPIGNTGSYLPVAEFLKGKDVNTVGDLCGDDGNRVPAANLPTDKNLAAMLVRASGFFESAVFRGERYALADLLALPVGSPSQGLMYQIISDVTMALLFERRPTLASDPDVMKRSEAWLTALSNGDMIFAFQEVAKAGIIEAQAETTQDVDARDGLTVITKDFFGRRANRWPMVG